MQICNVFADSIYLPLAAGMLRAYARADAELAASYDFAPILNERFDLAEVEQRISDPAVVGLSSYVWNWEYSLALARRLKQLYPEVLIVIGGPQVPEDASSLIAEGVVDVAVHGEGEVTFAEVLRAHAQGRPLADVAGVTARTEGGIERAARRERVGNLDTLPSPFLEGDFDDLLGGPRQLIGLWETNRGCPFGCTFCYWGSAVNTRVRQFGMQRLMRELDWFETQRIDYVLCADANFGIKKRDIEIARNVATAKRRSGYPRKFRTFSTKNASGRVLDVVEVLRGEGLDMGMSLTMQSLSEDALSAIGRKNIKLSTYVELRREAGKRGMPTYCDLIVGLPGETYDSFLDGLDRLMSLGQHDNVHVYTCTQLVGSEMADPAYREKHGIVSARSPIIERHMRADAISDGSIVEYEDVVVATRTMPLESWIETNLATVIVNVLHYQKVAHWPAIYLHHEHGVRYRRWYEHVKDAARRGGAPRLAEAARFTEEYYRSIAEGRTRRLAFPEFGNVIWPIEEAVFLLLSKNFDGLYGELQALFSELCRADGIALDDSVAADLFAYQMAQVPRHGGPIAEKVVLEHDWPAYFAAALSGKRSVLQRTTTPLSIVDQHQTAGDLAAYALKVAWYARSSTDIPYHLERLPPEPLRDARAAS